MQITPTKQALTALAALGALALLAHPARAGLVIQAQNATTAPGGTGSFDVDLLDTGGSDNVGGFSFELSVPAGVTFTGVGTGTTAPYIFGALQSPPLTFNTFPDTDFIASDTDQSAPSVAVGTGDVLGLGRVTYSVAPGTALGPVPISLVSGTGTGLTDGNGDPISFTTQDGTIIVSNASVAPEVPESCTLSLLALGLGGLLLAARRKSARRA